MTMVQRESQHADIAELTEAWLAFDRLASLRPIHTEADYDRTVALMNRVLDVVGEDTSHPMAGLLHLIGELVSNYDSGHFAIPDSEPGELLQFLLETNELEESALHHIVPSQKLRAILAGRENIDAAIAEQLAAFFHTSPSVFIPH